MMHLNPAALGAARVRGRLAAAWRLVTLSAAWERLRIVAIPLGIGVGIRLLLAPFTSFAHDDYVWYQAAVGGEQNLPLYGRLEFPEPPVWGYLLEGLGQLLSHLGAGPTALGLADPHLAAVDATNLAFATTITSPLFNLAFKSILLASDLATALLLFSLVHRLTGSQSRARVAFCLWFLNPFVIFESAVHGALDSITALLVLSTLDLLLRDRLPWAGAALGLGVLTKVSPVFIGPMAVLYASRLLSSPRPPWREVLRRTVAFGGGAVAVAMLLLVPELLRGSAGGALHAIFARVTQGATVGGVGLTGLRSFRGFGWLPGEIATHRTLVGDGISAIQVGVALAVGALAARLGRHRPAFALMAGTAVILGVVVLIAPLANPHWLLWMLPAVVVLAVTWRIGRWQLVALSVLPMLFLLVAVIGPLAVLAPLAEYTGIISAARVADSVGAWLAQAAAPWSTFGGSNYRGPLTLGIIVALVALMVSLGRAIVERRVPVADAVTLPPPPSNLLARMRGPLESLPSRLWVWLRPRLCAPMCVLIGVIVLAEVAAYRPPPLSAPHGSVQLVATSIDAAQRTTAELAVHPGPGVDVVRLLAFTVTERPRDRAVAVFDDPAYPMLGADVRSVLGVYDHLSAELRLHGYGAGVSTVDGSGLVRLLRRTDQASSTALVLMTGVLPSEVFAPGRDLISPWVRAGGVLIWGGPAIGFFTADRGHPGSPAVSRVLGPAGTRALVGAGAVLFGRHEGRAALQPSDVAQAFGLRYQLTNVSLPAADPTPVRLALGWNGEGSSSIEAVAAGHGRIVMFAGTVYQEEVVAGDIARILGSGMLFTASPFRFHDVPASSISSTVSWQPDLRPKGRPLVLLAFDPSPEGALFSRHVVETGPRG